MSGNTDLWIRQPPGRYPRLRLVAEEGPSLPCVSSVHKIRMHLCVRAASRARKCKMRFSPRVRAASRAASEGKKRNAAEENSSLELCAISQMARPTVRSPPGGFHVSQWEDESCEGTSCRRRVARNWLWPCIKYHRARTADTRRYSRTHVHRMHARMRVLACTSRRRTWTRERRRRRRCDRRLLREEQHSVARQAARTCSCMRKRKWGKTDHPRVCPNAPMRIRAADNPDAGRRAAVCFSVPRRRLVAAKNRGCV